MADIRQEEEKRGGEMTPRGAHAWRAGLAYAHDPSEARKCETHAFRGSALSL